MRGMIPDEIARARRLRARATLAALGLALAACGAEPDARESARPPRLVILYAACTVNKAFLAPYEARVRFTPELAAFAAKARVFRRHVCESAQSGIDFATLFTGNQADRHGTYDHPSVLAETNVLAAERFAAAGYETYFWDGHPMASWRLGYGQGVPPARIARRERMFRQSARPFDETYLEKLAGNDADFEGILARMEADASARVFVQLAFTVSHEPYHQYASVDEVCAFLERFPEVAPGVTRAELERWLPFYEQHRHALNWDLAAARRALALGEGDLLRLAAVLEAVYATSIHRLDALFGRFVATIERSGLAKECLLAFTVDHGELLYRENALFPWTHGPEPTPEVLDVAWILRAPGVAPGAYEGVTRSIDVAPTLLGLCGIELEPPVEGTDLAPVLRGERAEPRQLAFSHTPLWPEDQIERWAEHELVHSILPRRDPEVMSVRVRDMDTVFKLQRTRDETFEPRAFDLALDPGEVRNLFDPSDPAHARMAEELARYKQRLVDGFDPAHGSGLSDDETYERLKALGYAR
jgi:arylsulfatase A-like enzyme